MATETKNSYKPMICTDVDEDIYIFKTYGKTMKHTPSWTPRPRFDIISWNSSLYQHHLYGNVNIDSMTDNFTRQYFLQIIKDSWDYFCEVGASQSMLDFEFCINTGNAKTIGCR